jgi:hypothetical protein
VPARGSLNSAALLPRLAGCFALNLILRILPGVLVEIASPLFSFKRLLAPKA